MDDSVRIQITPDVSVLVDQKDVPLMQAHRWSTFKSKNGRYYVNTRLGGRTAYLHRLILQAPEGVEVDHISRDTLDNRRCNLRLVTHHQNLQNADWERRRSATGYRGVSKLKDQKGHRTKPYVAQIGFCGKHITCGVYATVEEAAAVAERMRQRASQLADAGIREWVKTN